jgi:hypothetical protein
MGRRIVLDIDEAGYEELERSARARGESVEAVCAEAVREIIDELRARREDPLFKFLAKAAAEGEPCRREVEQGPPRPNDRRDDPFFKAWREVMAMGRRSGYTDVSTRHDEHLAGEE